jgi:hypothetical protein
MSTPFDAAIDAIKAARYHNHRLETHSDLVSDGIIADLTTKCRPFSNDLKTGIVRVWKNVPAPGDRLRKIDLFVGEPDRDGNPSIASTRIAIENKSVITAHRNRTNRFDDLRKVLSAVHGARPEALLVATVLVGMAQAVLNIPDQVHKFYRDREDEFDEAVRPRLSTGDASLWQQFNFAVSRNSATDPSRTIELFRTLPIRTAGQTHLNAYDAVLLVPVRIDNVNPPGVERVNTVGIDVDREYTQLIDRMCSAYTARWHM